MEEYINSLAVEMNTGERETDEDEKEDEDDHEQAEEIPGFEGTREALNNL